MESALALTFGSIGEDELLARRQVPGRGWLMNKSPAWPWDFEIGWASVPGCLITCLCNNNRKRRPGLWRSTVLGVEVL